VKGSKLPNVVCLLPGSSDKVIIVGAHFDHVPEGDGVVDNWSGASLLPSLYQATKIESRKHTYIFIGFTDEEKGEVGSRFYARQMTKEQVGATDAMVNMDTLGLAPTEVWASHSDKNMTGALVYIAKQLNIPVTAVNVDQIGSSDSVQFSERKIPSITIHSLTQETFDARILHTSKDKLSAMRLDDYYQTYKLLSAYLVFLDQVLGVQTPSSTH
jgi:Zn-dependent M28 family amino/carboxypeptidase